MHESSTEAQLAVARGTAGALRRDTTRRAGARPGAPDVPAFAVPRERLLSVLEVAAARPATVVVAPPGYGKTVLCSQWAAQHDRTRVGWLTLDAAHDDPHRFVTDLRVALRLAPRRGRGRRPADASRSPGGDELLEWLAAELDGMPATTLVLDDLHLLSNRSLLDALVGLVEHADGSLRVVAATRHDPPTRFHRLRLADALVELRQEDMAFTRAEAAELLQRIAGRDVGAQLVDQLVERTEGWPAALHLAALALRGTEDTVRFVESFAVDDRHVVDRLTESVLEQVPEATRRFLLDTSVLDRMNASLCDHVTATTGGYAMLEELARTSTFVTRLPGAGPWYRAHGLFRAVLRRRLRAEDPRRELTLTRRAARWHLAKGDASIAVNHLAQAHAWDELIDVVSTGARALLLENRPSEVTRQLELVPNRVRLRRSEVVLLQAAAAIAAGDAVAGSRWLDRAGALAARPEEAIVVDLLRAAALVQRGEARSALRVAEGVRRRVDDIDDSTLPDVFGLTSSRGDVAVAAQLCSGVALCLLGRMSEATAGLEGAHDEAMRSGQVPAQLVAQSWLALARAWDGRLRDANVLAARVLKLSRELRLEELPVLTPARVALAAVARERGDVVGASGCLEEASRHADATRRPIDDAIVTIEQALLAAARGAPAEGLTSLAAHRGALPLVHVPGLDARRRAAEAHLLVLAGDLDRAEAVLERAADTPEVYSARIRVALERGDRERARAVLARWPDESTPRGRLGRMCWSAALDDVDGSEAAAASIGHVLVDTEAEHWVGLFRDSSPFVLRPLRARRRVAPTPFLREVLDRCGAAPSGRSSTGLVESLTERERFVLALLPTRLSNAQLAERLGMSLNTLKTHLKHIYRKLGVEGRADAVAEAERTRLL